MQTTKQLSINLQGMKFMKNTTCQKQSQEPQRKVQKKWGKTALQTSNPSTSSFLPFLKITKMGHGRHSVGGFNKDIEKLYPSSPLLQQQPADITDEEMVRTYQANSSFNIKRKRNEDNEKLKEMKTLLNDTAKTQFPVDNGIFKVDDAAKIADNRVFKKPKS